MGWFSRKAPTTPDRSADVVNVEARRTALESLDDESLDRIGREAATITDLVAASAVIAERVLGERMFPSQIRAALAMAAGQLVEMPTGEGKTLAAVPAATTSRVATPSG
jgi:preprotein translocase subunit SecA